MVIHPEIVHRLPDGRLSMAVVPHVLQSPVYDPAEPVEDVDTSRAAWQKANTFPGIVVPGLAQDRQIHTVRLPKSVLRKVSKYTGYWRTVTPGRLNDNPHGS